MPLYLLFVLLAAGAPAPDTLGGPPESRAGDVSPAEDFDAALTDILQQVVTDDGRVRYDLLRGPLRLPFRRVLKAVETYDLHRLRTFEEELAFWLNAYNVQMLQNVLATRGLRRIVGDGHEEAFFRAPVLTAQRGLTLDEIEHVILRRGDGRPQAEALRLDRLDPRLHVGLNCAAIGCPPLPSAAYTGATVDAQLDRAMRAFTARSQFFRVTADGFVLSALLDWFGADFEVAGQPAGDYLLSFMPPDRPGYEQLRTLLAGQSAAAIRQHAHVRFEYDWRVNAAPSPN